ncbi:MAG: family 43 glycosylhydrolase [Oscillospiraceae bacterium]|nr:family 43 glycosylhydrolase [Oscillospiraceae bacterium]
MIITNVEGLRDPFVLLDNGIYYLYGTGVVGNDWDHTVWDCYVNSSGKLDGEWKKSKALIYEKPAYAEKQLWAPEVHKYNGAYYMLASYYSSKTNHRGTLVLKAPSPTGPFVEISDGHVTPHDIDAIDGTLYVDKNNQPWLVFVHEWTCTDDGIGRMDAAKLSDDLTHLVSEPVELFRADSPVWTNRNVTDGCFVHRLSDGNLIMLWSNFEDNGYCIGVVHSNSGTVDGQWEHEKVPLYKRGILDHYDGGHGMLFRDADGAQYICCHSPNNPCEACRERTVFIPVEEREGTLRIK